MENNLSVMRTLSVNKYLSFSNIEWENIKLSPEAICLECHRSLANLKSYTNAFWQCENIFVLMLFRDIYLKSPYYHDIYPLKISLGNVYEQIGKFFEGIEQNSKTMCLEEAIAQYINNELIKHPKEYNKNIFVPSYEFYNNGLENISRDLTQIQEKCQRYKDTYMASIYDVDKMDARSLKYFLMLLYARQGYKIIPIKQKNMFYIQKGQEKYIVQGKIGKITAANALKYYETSPKDAPLLIVTNIENQNIDTFVNIITRAELEKMISETKSLLDYRFLNDDFTNHVKEGIYHSLTIDKEF